MELVDKLSSDQWFQIFWIAPIRAHTGINIDFQPSFYEVDNIQLDWTLFNAPSWMSVNSSTGYISGAPVSEAVHADIVLTARRITDSATRSITFTCSVDNSKFVFVSTSGNNGNPGTLASPKLTVAGAAALVTGSAGRTIMMRAGTYTEVGFSVFNSKGRNAADYQHLRNYPGELPVWTLGVASTPISLGDTDAKYVVMDGIKYGAGEPSVNASALFVDLAFQAVRGCIPYNQDGEDNMGGIHVKPAATLLDDDVIIIDRNISHGNYSRTAAINNSVNNNSAGILVYTNSGGTGNANAHIWVLNNKCYENGNGIKTKHSGADTLIVQNNECVLNGRHNIHVGGPNTIVRFNVTLDALDYEVRPAADNVTSTNGPTYFAQNTVVHRDTTAFELLTIGQDTSDNGGYFKRNIIASTNATGRECVVIWEYVADWTGETIEIDHNVQFSSNATPFKAGGSAPNGDLTWAQWNTKSAGLGFFDINGSNSDPAFQNVNAGRLEITSSSPAALITGGWAGALEPGKTYGVFGEATEVLVNFNINGTEGESEEPPVEIDVREYMSIFNAGHPGPMFSASSLTAITPSDSTDLSGTRGIYVGTAGNISIIAEDDITAVTLTNVPAGVVLPIFVKRVMAATTATGLVAFR